MADLFTRISDVDVRQFFRNTLCLYKDKPVFVRETEGFNLSITHLETGAKQNVLFNAKDFGPLRERIGMVNEGGNVFFVKRTPVRIMQIGHSTSNTKVDCVIQTRSEDGYYGSRDAVRGLQKPSVYSAIANKYPTFKTAVSKAKLIGGMAFDKQFAVDYNGNIYYRTQKVGTIGDGAESVGDIRFKAGMEYLSLLLDKNYAKHPGNFRSK